VKRRRDGSQYQYVLGDSQSESSRLDLQAQLWDPIAHALFDRVRIKPGMKVLEIGPGRGSVHLELRRRVQAPVDFVERSPVFAEALRMQCAADGLGTGTLWCSDLLDSGLPDAEYDFIYTRWVFCFLPDVEAHLRKLAAALKPGGCLAIQDYSHRESFALFPRPAEWADFLAADRAFFASQGGDISVAGGLPFRFRTAGLLLTEATHTHMVGGPGAPVWDWLWQYFLSVRDRLAEIPPLTVAKAAALDAAWRDAANNSLARIAAPTVVDLVTVRQ
jgi:SAM-dependent methyltransferase